jgi:iron complex outermembrane receptor protein
MRVIMGGDTHAGGSNILRSAVAMLLATTATAAYAQQAPAIAAPAAPAAPQAESALPAEASPTATDTGLGEIVVTASKRSENLQRAAISITAISSASMQARGLTDMGQLAGLAPAVQFQPSFLLLTYIRGVGNYSSQPAVDQSVAYNVDGIYLDRPYAVPNLMFDLERIELTRGPQGTLQGRNSTGGSVDLITARPTMDFAAKASVSAGNYGLIATEGMINVKLADDIALRISGGSSQHNGYFDNGFGDQNAMGVRARLLAHPTSRLEILLTGEYSRQNAKGPTDSPCPPGSADVACIGVKWRPFAGTAGQGTAATIDEPQVLKDTNYAVYAQVNYDLDFATLTWVPNYRSVKYRSNQAYSAAFGYAPAVRDQMHSEELRLASKAGSPITWVAGLYYGRQHSREQNYFLTGLGPSITVNEPGFETVTHVYFKNDIDRYVYRSQSVFGQVSVPLFDGFRVVAGGRYTQDKKTLEGRTGLVVAGPTLVTVDVGGRQKLNRFTYKAGVEYDIAPQVMGYANISTGFKSGGVNGVPPNSGVSPIFGPEKNTAYQAGIKSRFFDNRLQINTEAFYYDYRGYQTSSFFTTAQGITIGLNVNSQKARMYGGEVEANFLLTPNDRFDANMSLLHAKYVTFVVPATGLNLSGGRLQNAPGHTFNLGYGHTFELASGGKFVAHGEGHYESNQYVDYRLSPGSLQKGYFRGNADLTYTAPDGRWTLGAFVNNITNNGALSTAVGGLGPYELGVPLPPRTFGARASAKF